MKMITILTPCYNEEENVEALCLAVRNQFELLPQYDNEHIFIDNASKDRTVSILKKIAIKDKHVKIIVNAKNFGHIRSPYYGLLQANGDAVLLLVADFQDPVDLIPLFLSKWEEGYKIVIGVKSKSKENALMFKIRKIFYSLIKKISETEQIENFTGFGLYDRHFVDILKTIDDPYPYFRGMVAELGFDRYEIMYTQPAREKGKTKNNFYTLYDMAMLGFVNHSKLPLRMASFIGFIVAMIS